MKTLGSPAGWDPARNSSVVLQRLHGYLAHCLRDVGRIDDAGEAAEPQHQLREPRWVPDTQRNGQLTLWLLDGLFDRVVLRDPARAGSEPNGDHQALPGRLEDAVREVAWLDVAVVLDRGIEHLGPRYPVKPEQPLVLGHVAPGGEIGVAVGGDHAQGVDDALGGLVSGGHVVVQPHLAPLFHSTDEALPQLVDGGGPPGHPDVDLRGDPRAISRRGLELVQGAVDDGAYVVVAALTQGSQSDDQRRCLGAVESQRTAEVVRVRQPDDALSLKRLHVDLDEVAHPEAWQPAEPQHIEVLDDLRG